MSAINRARGETGLSINGEHYALCLTLGALAQIEAALEIKDLEALSQRLRQLSAADVLAVLEALLLGGGHAVGDTFLRTARIDPTEAAEAIAAAFSLAMREA